MTTQRNGDPESIATAVRTHLDAGADHVIVRPAIAEDHGAGVHTLERLAPTLTAVDARADTTTKES